MKRFTQAICIIILIALFACGERKRVAGDSVEFASQSNLTGDSLDSMSLAVLRYLRMHEISSFIGVPAREFRDSIPFSTTWPSFGWEDGWMNTIHYSYEGTQLNVSIRVTDCPYRFDLDTMKMLDMHPEKMFEYNVTEICVGIRNKCLIEARSK